MTRTVITGGPGSGKTTVLTERARDYFATHPHSRQPGLLVCAPDPAGVHQVASRIAGHLPAGSALLAGTIRDLASHGTKPLPYPWLLVVDGVEDCAIGELDLVACWAANSTAAFAAVDVDQQVPAYTGVSPAQVSAFVHAADEIQHLTRSHRVPTAIVEATTPWLEYLPNPHRRHLTPADHDQPDQAGAVRRTAASVHDPLLVDQLVDDLDLGRTVLVATLSGPLLGPLVASLRAAGVPHRDLTAPDPDPRTAEALAAFLALDEREQPDTAREWTGGDVRAFLAVCRPSGAGLRAGTRRLIDALPDQAPVPFEVLADVWADDAQRERALDPDPAWLLDAAKPGCRSRLRHLVTVAERNGYAELVRPPRVLVGTVDAVKHVEADVVYLSPDLTPAQADEWWGGRRDRITRRAYVAATRARTEMVQLTPVSRYALPDAMFVTERGQP